MTMLSHFAAAGGAVPVYIEDIFSTYLYTGNGSTQTITNGIDLLGKGGLVLFKSRTEGSSKYFGYTGFVDTARGTGSLITSFNSNAEVLSSTFVNAFNSTGFGVGSAANSNYNGDAFVSWTFRKQPKFFDVVTYTGNGNNAGQTINHNLGSVPGAIICKSTSATGDWAVCARTGSGTPTNAYATGLSLNSTGAALYSGSLGDYPTATTFSTAGIFDNPGNYPNANGVTYVAYLFAHNAGGFGLTGTDNVISCGSYTGTSVVGNEINVGFEPQFIIIKRATGTAENWQMFDNMRGIATGGNDAVLYPNLSNAEYAAANAIGLTATGFKIEGSGLNVSGDTYIYIAIRRGPMKTPTNGTSVFGLNARTGTGANATVTGSAGVSDAVLIKNRGAAVGDLFASRLTGTGYLETSSTAAEVAAGATILQANPWDVMDGVKVGTTSTITNASANTYINYLFDRAPGFFDQIVYTGTAANTTVPHGLTVVPEMMIFKARQSATNWAVYHKDVGATKALYLNQNVAPVTNSVFFNNTAPTASVVSLGSSSTTNSNFATNEMLCYLFASCPGVSKVGSYTGTGTTQQINCGFTSGARFVLIKATSATGNWYVWDTARGIVAGNDPYLLLNSAGAEVTTTDWVDAAASGFELSNAAGNLANSSGVSYIFLAIA